MSADVLGDAGLGLATTAWPFLVALALGWLVCLGWRRPLSIVRTAVPVWVVTVAGGMLLRAVSDQGTALPFVIVATVTLLVLLVGWRLDHRCRATDARSLGRSRLGCFAAGVEWEVDAVAAHQPCLDPVDADRLRHPSRP